MLKKVTILLIFIILFNLSFVHSFPTNYSKIAIIGDSISLNYNNKGYPVKLDKFLNSNSSKYNFAEGGMKCDYVRDVEILKIENNTEYVILLCGTNDIYQGESAGTVINEIKEIYNQLNKKNIKLIILTIPPYDRSVDCQKILAVNNFIRSYSKQNGIIFVDIFKNLYNGSSCNIKKELYRDGVHPNEKGNELIAYSIWNDGLSKQTYEIDIELESVGLIKSILNWFENTIT